MLLKEPVYNENTPVTEIQNDLIVKELFDIYSQVIENGRQVYCLDTQKDGVLHPEVIENLQSKIYDQGMLQNGSSLEGFKVYADLEEGVLTFGLEARSCKDGSPKDIKFLVKQNENSPYRNYQLVKTKEFHKSPGLVTKSACDLNETDMDMILYLVSLSKQRGFECDDVMRGMEKAIEDLQLKKDLEYLEEIIPKNSHRNLKFDRNRFVAFGRNRFGEITLELKKCESDNYILQIRRLGDKFFFKRNHHFEKCGEDGTIPQMDRGTRELFGEMVSTAINGINDRRMKSLTL